MTGDCGTDTATLWDFVDGTLDESATAAVREHLAGCQACSERIAGIEQLDAGLAEIASAAKVDVPESIAGYRIVRQLGAGGMGIVYEARQPRPDREVALKVMRPDGAGDSRRLRAFRREIEALGRLSHPSIATVYDAGRTEDGRFYFVMELVRGRPLDRYCEVEALALRARVELAAGIVEAVQYAHGRGIAHRDLKPGNVLVDDAGTARVLDFGLARFLDGDDVTRSETATVIGPLVGTLPYIPPERLRGAPDAGCDVQADVYALGVMLHELATGRRPYDFGSDVTAQTAMQAIDRTEPRHPSRINAAVPRQLGDVIAIATAKDPGMRYATAADLCADLRRFLEGEPVLARPPGLAHRARRLLTRHGRVLTATLVTAALATAATGWALAGQTNDGDPLSSHLAIARAPMEFSIFGRQIDFTSDGKRAVHLYHAGGNGPPLAIWNRSTSTSTPLDLPAGDRLNSPRWSPDGERIAMLGSGHETWFLSVLHLPTGEVTELYRATTDRERQPHDLCWTPGGERITFVTRECAIYDVTLQGEITRWGFSTGSDRWQLGGYSPDGEWLLCEVIADRLVSEATDLWLVPRGGGRALQLTATAANEHSSTFDPDGEAIWFVRDCDADSNILRLPFEREHSHPGAIAESITRDRGRRLRDLDFVGNRDLVCRVVHTEHDIWVQRAGAEPARPLTRGRDPVLSPDAETMYFLDASHSICALRVDDATEPVRVTQPLANAEPSFGSPPVYHLAADGHSLIYGAAEGAAYGVFEASLSSAPRLLATTTKPTVPRWSPDGARVAFIDDERLIVLDRTGGERRELGVEVWAWEHWTVRWSPAGDLLVAVGYSDPAEFERHVNTVFAIDVATGAVRRLTPPGDAYKERVEWHPDGSRLTCLVYADTGECVRDIWLDGRPATALFDEPGHCPFHGSWSPFGEYVFWCGGGDRCEGGLHVVRADGSVRYEDHGYEQPPRWARDTEAHVWVRPRLLIHFEQLHAVR